MAHCINLDGRAVFYEIKRDGRARRLIFRVGEDGTVKVTAPKSVSVSFIERAFPNVADFILKSLAENEEKRAAVPRLSEYREGEEFLLFGKPMKLSLFAGKSPSVSLTETVLSITYKPPYSREKTKRVADAFLRKEVERTVLRFAEKCYAEMKISAPFPKLVFRNAVSRWGRCTPEKNEVMFNYALFAVPLSAVEYVVYHEFCHFFELNHSPKFYAVMERFLLDWKTRRAELKKFVLAGKGYYI